LGDLVELVARKVLFSLKKLRNLIEQDARIGRWGVLHAILPSRHSNGEGAAPGQCVEELLQLQQLRGAISSKQMPMPERV